MPPSGPFARLVVLITRGFGALALFAGLYLLALAGLLIFRREIDWAKDFRGLIVAAILIGWDGYKAYLRHSGKPAAQAPRAGGAVPPVAHA